MVTVITTTIDPASFQSHNGATPWYTPDSYSLAFVYLQFFTVNWAITFSCVWCNILTSISYRLFLFKITSVDSPYQHPFFLMCVMIHHHTHTVSSSCLNTIRWPTIPTPVIPNTCNAILSHARRLIIPVCNTFRWLTVPTLVLPQACDATSSHAHRLVILFENPYVDSSY